MVVDILGKVGATWQVGNFRKEVPPLGGDSDDLTWEARHADLGGKQTEHQEQTTRQTDLQDRGFNYVL